MPSRRDRKKTLYGVSWFAREVGVSPATIYNWVAAGEDIPHLKFGGKLYFTEDHVKELAARRHGKPSKEVVPKEASPAIRTRQELANKLLEMAEELARAG